VYKGVFVRIHVIATLAGDAMTAQMKELKADKKELEQKAKINDMQIIADEIGTLRKTVSDTP
jgi:hypothetical protein